MGFVIANWKWLFSGIAFVLYVAVQHGLYVSLVRACREFRDALESNAPDYVAKTGGFSWLQNVRVMFAQNGSMIANSPLPHGAVIDALDSEIWRASKYTAMQRWGLAAPLIGVILSALGFMVSPPELTGEVSDIMGKLGPLFVGVFVGALMALVNQVYLHFSALELGRVRARAVAWFDEIIWKAVGQNAHNVLGQAAAETQSAAKHLEASSQQLATCNITYRDSLLELNRQLTDVRTAASSTSSSFDSFSKMMNDMTTQLASAIKNIGALNATVAAVENGSVVWNIAAAKLSNASTAIETSSKKFQDGIAESTSGLISVVAGIAEPMKKLHSSISDMQMNTDKHTELTQSLTSAISQSDRFLVERLALNVDEADLQREMASRTRAAIESLQKLAETASVVNATGSTLNQAAGGLRDASTTIDGAVKGLFDSCKEFTARNAEAQTKMSAGVTEATAGLQSAARELAHPVGLLNNSFARISTGNQDHAELSERLENLTKMGERVLQDRFQANGDEATRAARIEGTEKRLEATSQVLSDSAATMREIQQGLDALVQELRMAREGKVVKGGRWLSWLSNSRMKDAPALQFDGKTDEKE